MTFHCDKLCSCDTCVPIRWALSYVKTMGKPLGSYAAACHRESTTYLAAWFASRDPAKLAELMASGLRARGIDAVFRRLSDYGTHGLVVHDVAIWDRSETTPDAILLDVKDHCVWRIVCTSKARAKLLAIMQTAHDESSREACEQILKGKP